MNKRGTGAVFCLIAALLYAARYLTAAIFMGNVSSWSQDLFRLGFEYQGSGLLVASIISLIVGLGYLIWGEIEERKKH